MFDVSPLSPDRARHRRKSGTSAWAPLDRAAPRPATAGGENGFATAFERSGCATSAVRSPTTTRCFTQRREMSARATALARGIDDAATLADVLNGRLAAAQDPDEIGERSVHAAPL